MKKILPLLLLSIIIVFGSCASKRLSKRALKFETAGMYEMAADLFYQSLSSNTKNVKAAIGLKKNGQRLLDDKAMKVHQAYFNNDDRATVYSYLEAQAYYDKVKALGVSLNLSETAQSYYNEAKPQYIQSLYNEARILLDEEKFRESEAKFAEIKQIDPDYQGIDEHMRVAKSEPIYRQGRINLETGFFRKAYYNFNDILTTYGSYKDAKELRNEALTKAQITIAIGRIENHSHIEKSELLVESAVTAAINNLDNPFIKVVNAKKSTSLGNQQSRNVRFGSDINVGNILAAKSVLTGSIIKFTETTNKPRRVERKAYLKEMISVKDAETGETKKEPKYTKVTYQETTLRNEASISFQFKLTSVETGALWASDAINLTNADGTVYATFSGDYSKLVPGHWESKEKSSPKDVINDNRTAVDQLQRQFKAPKEIKSVQQLRNELIDNVSRRVAKKINDYNPES